MPRALIALFVIGVVAAAPVVAGCQQLTVEVRADATIPREDPGGVYDRAGLTFGGRLGLAVSPQVGVYAGYSRLSLGYDLDELGMTGSVESDLFEAGARFRLPLGDVVAPYVSLAALRLEDETGFAGGIGAEYGGGGGGRFVATPELRYSSVSDFDFLSFGVGVGIRF